MATVTSPATATVGVAPHLPAARITALWAKPVEDLTVSELRELLDAVARLPRGSDPAATLRSIFAPV